MYEQYFGLSRRPFLPAPTLECVVEHAGYVAARDAILRSISDRSGICVLTAPAGLGKSLLCQDLHSRIEGDATVVYLCSAQFPNRRSLLQAILFELHENYQGLTEDEARLVVMESVRSHGRESRRLVVILDEAHLVSSELLEELRILAEPIRGGEAGMQLILAGQLEFEERLADRELDSLNQRIGCHAVIEPLTQEESAGYIGSRLAWAGASLDLFSRDALSLIVNICDGNPRCMHQLCDHCFLSALSSGERQISVATVKASFDDLRSLPLHWNDAALDGADSDLSEEDEPFDENFERMHEREEAPSAASTPASSMSSGGPTSSGQDVAFVEIGGEETLFRSVDPWTKQAPDAAGGRQTNMGRPAMESAGTFELVPDDDVIQIDGESVVEDPYARIDRIAETASPPAIPAPPDLMTFLSQFAIDGSEPVSQQPKTYAPAAEAASHEDEESLLETIRGLQAELRMARSLEQVDPAVNWTTSELMRFDVIEPEIDEPSPVETSRQDLSTIDNPTPACETRSEASARTDDAEPEPSARYSRLFTRIRQRRRAARERLDRDDVI